MVTEYRAMLTDLPAALAEVSVPRARAAIRSLTDVLRVEEKDDRVEIWSTRSPEAALLKVAGGPEQICVVAGVGFEPTTFGL